MDKGLKVIDVEAVPVTGAKPVSVWDLEKFPVNVGRNFNVTPATLRAALDEYGEDPSNLHSILTKHGVRWNTFFDLMERYEEVRVEYCRARMRKAPVLGGSAQEIYDSGIPDFCFELDKNNNQKLSVAGIKYLRDKFEAKLRLAEIAETGSYVQRKQVDQRSVSLNYNAGGAVDIPEDIEKMGPDELAGLLNSMGRNMSR